MAKQQVDNNSNSNNDDSSSNNSSNSNKARYRNSDLHDMTAWLLLASSFLFVSSIQGKAHYLFFFCTNCEF